MSDHRLDHYTLTSTIGLLAMTVIPFLGHLSHCHSYLICIDF